jgi:PmbA protein
MPDARNLLADLIAAAKRRGADEADAVLVDAASLSYGCRLGVTEKLERAESTDLGLRVFVGRRQAIVSSTDRSPAMLKELVERAVAMAKAAPEDPYCGLADPAEIARAVPELDLADPAEPGPAALEERARATEDAARAVAGITNSEGAEAGWGKSQITLVASNGFSGGYASTHHGVGVAVIAGSGTGMERDYDYSSAVYAADLEDAQVIGRRAGEQAVKRLNPSKPATAKMPVVMHPRVARSLVSHLAAALNGEAVARGTSFLKDSMGKRILPEGVFLVDDPLRRRGHASRPFDGEGLPASRREMVADGVLAAWFLDLRSARQLGLKPSGQAARGVSSPPSPAASNLHLSPGKLGPRALMADIGDGLYVTELVGFGVNYVTGDYSRGATGFRIVKGELAGPVSEITIAGNLRDMFLALTLADDLEFRYASNAPTLRLDGLTVAGA